MTEFHIKAGDTRPSLTATATLEDGTALDLTTATSVMFRMRRAGESAFAVERAAVVVAPTTSGIVRYDFVAGDTATPGVHYADFAVTFSGGAKQTIPTRGSIVVHVVPATVGKP